MEPLWTIEQAAEYAAVDPATIRRWIAAGRLRAGKVGRTVRIDPADVRAAFGLTVPDEETTR